MTYSKTIKTFTVTFAVTGTYSDKWNYDTTNLTILKQIATSTFETIYSGKITGSITVPYGTVLYYSGQGISDGTWSYKVASNSWTIIEDTVCTLSMSSKECLTCSDSTTCGTNSSCTNCSSTGIVCGSNSKSSGGTCSTAAQRGGCTTTANRMVIG